MTKGQALRKILAEPGIRVTAGTYDCLGALLAQSLGYEFIFTSGFGISASNLGKPDFGYLTATENLTAVHGIAQSVDIPVIADLDTGYGNPLSVVRFVSEAVRVGAAGIILEDQEWPKKCGHFDGKRVIPRQEHVEKIHAAVEARGDSGLVIVGRTDARAVNGLDDALRRAHDYAEAGADVIFVEAPQSVEELKIVAREFPDTYLFANMIEGGKTPMLTATELDELGYKIVVFALAGLFAATMAQMKALKHIRDHGTSTGLTDLLDFKGFEQVLGTARYREQERRFVAED